MKTRVAEPGDHKQRLFMRTGVDAQENQARRLLNDIAGFRGYLEQKGGHPVPESVAANRWLNEVYDPVVDAIPPPLRGRLAPPEIFHEILLHRWYLSEAAGHDVGTTAAAQSYYASVLPLSQSSSALATWCRSPSVLPPSGHVLVLRAVSRSDGSRDRHPARCGAWYTAQIPGMSATTEMCMEDASAMATTKQKTAARQNIKKAQAASQRGDASHSEEMSTAKRNSLGATPRSRSPRSARSRCQ